VNFPILYEMINKWV